MHPFAVVGAVAAAVYVAAQVAAAEEAAVSEATELESLVVTVSRTPVEGGAAGSSVTVITREQLENRQAIFIADVLRSVPGLAVSRVGTLGSQTQVRVRGAEANHVLVLIDGVEANDPAAGDEFQFEHLTTAGIERIEIVRGPQSALWGSDAVGGVINVITRRPAAPLSATGLLEGGAFGTLRAAAQLGFARRSGELGVGVSHLESDGTNISRQGDEEDGYANTSLDLAARRLLGEALEIDFFARHAEVTKEFDGVDFSLTGLPTDADNETESSQTYLRAGAALTLLGGRWRHALKLTGLSTDNDNSSAGLDSGSTAADKRGVYYQTTIELAGDAHLLTFAVDHEQEDFEQRGVATPFGDPNQRQSLRNTGYVLEYLGAPAGLFDLSAALRYDGNSDFGDVTTHRLTLSRRLPGSATRLHVSYGTGQKSPTFIERYGFFADTFLGNPALQPEKSRGLEAGLHQSFADRRIGLSAVYFDEQLEGEINGFVFDPSSGLFTAANDPGRSERRGLELALAAELSRRLDLTAAYTYTDASEPGPAGSPVGELRRPRHTAALNVSYAPLPRLRFNLDVAYTGGQLDRHFPPFPRPSRIVELDAFALVNLAAGYRFASGLEWIARIENLLDEAYEEALGFRAPGMAAYTGLRLRFE